MKVPLTLKRIFTKTPDDWPYDSPPKHGEYVKTVGNAEWYRHGDHWHAYRLKDECA